MYIESRVSMAIAKISDDATEDLRAMVDKVDENMAMKERLREVQRKLELYKEHVRNGQGGDAETVRDQMANDLEAMGLTADNSEEGQMVAQLPGAAELAGLDQEGRDELLSGTIKSFETLLDHRAQSLSDLGQKLQFMLQEKNNIFTRANKAQSDIMQKYSQSLDGIAQNLKG